VAHQLLTEKPLKDAEILLWPAIFVDGVPAMAHAKKIILTRDIDIHGMNFGLTNGREMTTLPEVNGRRGTWVMGDDGYAVKLWPWEWKETS